MLNNQLINWCENIIINIYNFVCFIIGFRYLFMPNAQHANILFFYFNNKAIFIYKLVMKIFCQILLLYNIPY